MSIKPWAVPLSRSMDEKTFHKVMDEVRNAESMGEGRWLAVMATCTDRLKADFDRRYRVEL